MKTSLLCLLGLMSVFMVGCGKQERIYEVGKDIEAGEYVLVGEGTNRLVENSKSVYCYYAICTKPSCDLLNEEVIENEFVGVENEVDTATFTIENNQYLLLVVLGLLL